MPAALFWRVVKDHVFTRVCLLTPTYWLIDVNVTCRKLNSNLSIAWHDCGGF